jgi:hypothetical protein
MLCKDISVRLYDIIHSIFSKKKVTEIIHGTYRDEFEDS